jgi:flavin reductase (DIM6/NTAB) family NADH-FMN oxidoreductase RutF
VTIHSSHPFADPEPDPARRFRGRLGGTATLWTAGRDAGRAGLTLTSVLVVLGEPARVLGLLDPDSDLADAIASTGSAVVQLLSWPDRDLADGFAGTAPAPGGVFAQAEFVDTEWGPRLAHATTWAGVRVESTGEIGWSRLLTCVVERLELGEDDAPLLHRRGRWLRPAD